MRATNTVWTAALILSGLALLSFLTRTLIDYRFVFAELGFGERELGWATLVTLAFYGGWIGALVAASHGGRKAMVALMAYGAVLIAFGLYTMTTLCPSPCRTFWPVGEIAIWSNVLVGLPATALAALSLFRHPTRGLGDHAGRWRSAR
jgi:uncharacterized membrane protein YsdA (DUF1294 family)